MKTFRIPYKEFDPRCLSNKSFSMTKEANELREQLEEVRVLLEEMMKHEKYRTLLDSRDLFRILKYHMFLRYYAHNPTLVWVKHYELIRQLDLCNLKTKVYFANNCLPGSTIFAFNQFNRIFNEGVTEWYANSKITDRDLYGLWAAHPDRFLMGDTDGDTTDLRTIEKVVENLQTRAGQKADFYSSEVDLKPYFTKKDSELKDTKFMLGQILTGVMSLNLHGNMFIKQFTFFEPFTITLMYLFRTMFRECFIVKPATSRKMDSETYLVGRDFLGAHPALLGALQRRMREFTNAPFVDEEFIKDDPEFRASISRAYKIFRKKIITIRGTIDAYVLYGIDYLRYIQENKAKRLKYLYRWLKENRIRILNLDERIPGVADDLEVFEDYDKYLEDRRIKDPLKR